MNVNTAANILLIAAAVVWILAKQVRAAPIKPRLLVLAPLVMGYFGVRDTPASTWKSGADLAFIGVGALLSVGLGLWRGTTIRVWRDGDGAWWRAGSKATLLLWGALLLVRGLSAGVADATGHKAADGLGPILLSLALSFAAQNAVIGSRMSGMGAASGPASGRPAGTAGFPPAPGTMAANNAPVNGTAWPGAGMPAGTPVADSAPVDLGRYQQPGANPGQYQQPGANPGQYQQPGTQPGPGWPADSGYGQAPGYPAQPRSLHERREQRRAARRARRGQRWDF